LGNVNVEEFCNFITQVDKNKDITNTYRDDINTNNELHFTTASTWDTSKTWPLDKYLQKGVDEGVLNEPDRAYFQVFSIAAGLNQVAFNCPRINNYKNNPYMASKELIYAKKAIWRLYNFAKKYFPGFQNAIITNIATQTGIREQNRVKTKCVFTKDDLINSKSFKNTVLKANYSIDIHSDKKNGSILQKTILPDGSIEETNTPANFAQYQEGSITLGGITITTSDNGKTLTAPDGVIHKLR
jgi:hypothetical protein